MGICDSRSAKKSQTIFLSSPTVCITPIIKQKNNNKKHKQIRFLDEANQQQQELSDNRSISPPPRFCFNSISRSSNKKILFRQMKVSGERLYQETQPVQSKQTLFGKTLRFQNLSKKGYRDGFKDSPQNK